MGPCHGSDWGSNPHQGASVSPLPGAICSTVPFRELPGDAFRIPVPLPVMPEAGVGLPTCSPRIATRCAMPGIRAEESTVPVTIHLTPRLRQELDAECEAKGIPLSRLVRERLRGPSLREADLAAKVAAAGDPAEFLGGWPLGVDQLFAEEVIRAGHQLAVHPVRGPGPAGPATRAPITVSCCMAAPGGSWSPRPVGRVPSCGETRRWWPRPTSSWPCGTAGAAAARGIACRPRFCCEQDFGDYLGHTRGLHHALRKPLR
jgi:hypothetical protein